ncbi:hypothetical protein scyTo_0028011 [Scyliorhinus torazame]|uniref:Proteasome subunit beta type-8 n=1 Tax=Scyliorhinus torazame TaxID=75743 RepID=A0A401QPJ6_SCYTO|nr:hypothetical protein [Scyliorhinus torazame]
MLDRGYQHDMSPKEAYDLAKQAIYHATYCDAYSGGIVSLYHVKETGWVRICRDDVMGLHQKYKDGCK